MTFKKIYLTIAVIPVVLVTILIVNNITFSNRNDFDLEKVMLFTIRIETKTTGITAIVR